MWRRLPGGISEDGEGRVSDDTVEGGAKTHSMYSDTGGCFPVQSLKFS